MKTETKKTSIAAALAGAIARRNVEKDGKVWRSGQTVDPTSEVLAAARADNKRDMADTQKIIDAIEALPDNVDVTALRAVLPADSHETTKTAALRSWCEVRANRKQYLQDMETAAAVFAEKTALARAFTGAQMASDSLDRTIADLEKNIRSSLDTLDRRIQEARATMSDGRTPNTCGIIQGLGAEIDAQVGRLDTAKTIRQSLKEAARFDARMER